MHLDPAELDHTRLHQNSVDIVALSGQEDCDFKIDDEVNDASNDKAD